MKKETILTAVVFFVVGFLAGYITDAQLSWNARQKIAATATPVGGMREGNEASAPATGGATSGNLPPGHPSIDPDSVVKQLEEMASQNPKDPGIPLKLADFLYDQKQYAKAISWYQRALELDPKNVNARTDLGTVYFYTGRPADALREYRKSLELNPRHEPTMVNMIVVNLEGTHDLAAAQAAWDRLHQLNPNHPALADLKQKLEAARAAGGAAASPQ